jgi:hypothetical protein
MPVCSADPTPVAAPVSSSKKSKVNTAQVAESRVLSINRCDTPEEFVRRIVYEGLPEKTLQYVTLGGPGQHIGDDGILFVPRGSWESSSGRDGSSR